ncbi:unnamed protein product [Rhizophagus irregularis]|nr:unnamed protein product [Rhizophagus irregularis]CAB5385864.1 unnamed protein product [Rhizophagus irregularis]
MTTNSEPFDNTINLLHKHYEELKEDNRRLKEEIEEIKEINNLINNNQKINPDLSNYVKLFQSHKELQEKFNSLSSQKQIIEKQLEDNIKLIETKENEIKNLIENNLNLKKQASKYQFALGDAINYQLGDDDNNNSVRLNDNIIRLQDEIDDYTDGAQNYPATS